jgi:hypothetical protein
VRDIGLAERTLEETVNPLVRDQTKAADSAAPQRGRAGFARAAVLHTV